MNDKNDNRVSLHALLSQQEASVQVLVLVQSQVDQLPTSQQVHITPNGKSRKEITFSVDKIMKEF